MKQALIVIDVQESFRKRPYWSEAGLAEYLERQQAVIDQAVAQGVPVVQVFHISPNGGAPDPFDPANGLVRTLAPLRIAPVAVFRKTVHSALYGVDDAGRTLEQWLRANGIGEVLVTGIRTEQCCETTTRHASDAGFRVRFVTDATHTFAMRHPVGREYTPEEIRERTELVLAGRFARIVNAAQAFA